MAAAGRVARPRALVLSPEEPAGFAARAALRYQAERLMGWQAEAPRGESEAIHQLRVAVRRMRAALFLFGSLAPELPVAVLMRDLGALGHAIGAVRNLDVLLEILERRARKLDRATAGKIEPLKRLAFEARAAALLRLLRVLRSRRCASISAHLLADASPADPGTSPLREAAAGLLRPMVRSMRRAGSRLSENSTPAEFHRLRVRAKRVRYALEILRPLAGKQGRKLLGRLEDLQGDFGALQDGEDALIWIRTHAESHEFPPATMIGAGAIIYALERRTHKLRRRAFKRWARVGRGGVIRAALRELGQSSALPDAPLVGQA